MKVILLAMVGAAAAAADGASVCARVRTFPGGPMITVDGKPVVPRICHVAENPRFYDHLTSTVRRAGEFGGVDLVSLATHKTDACWHEDGHEDWALLDDLCDKVVAMNPRALFFPRVRLFAPKWYLARHPEERVVFEDGTPGPDVTPSSRNFRREACAYLVRMITHLEAKYPEHFIGVHVTSQLTGEHQYHGSLEKLDGFDPTTLAAWRAHLRSVGEADADTATVPTADERRRVGFRGADPRADRRVFLFERFRQREMADQVAEFAHAAREATGGRKLVLAFYGYVFTMAGRSRSGPASTGHYALGYLLDRAADDLDILCSPVAYSDRAYAGSFPSMGADETVMRRGILHLDEDDLRTYLDHRGADPYLMEGERVTRAMSQQLLRRVTVQQGIRGYACWWMDLYGTGWYDSPELWDEQRQLRNWERALLARPEPYAPQVALVIGEDTMLLGGADRACTELRNWPLNALVREAPGATARAGADYGQYLQGDVAEHPVPARLQLMVASELMTEDEERGLADGRGLPEGGLRAWFGPAGLMDGSLKVDRTRAERICGFRLARKPERGTWIEATERGRALGLPVHWTIGKNDASAFAPADAKGDEVLAVWKDGTCAIAVRKLANGRHTAYSGAGGVTPQLARALGEIAGVRFLLPRDEIGRTIAYGAKGFLSVVAVDDGRHTLVLPDGAGTLRDGCRGQAIPFPADRMLRLDLKKGESRFYTYR